MAFWSVWLLDFRYCGLLYFIPNIIMYAFRELILWTISGFSRSLHRPVDPLRHYYVQSQNKGELSQVNQCTSFQTKLSIKPLQLTKNKGQGKKKNCKTWKKKTTTTTKQTRSKPKKDR